MLCLRVTLLLVLITGFFAACSDEAGVLEPHLPESSDPVWTALHPSPEINSLNAVCASEDGVVVAVGDRGAFLRSTDAGITWERVPLDDPHPAFTDIDMEDGFGIAINAEGRWYRTIDSGLEWTSEGYLGRDVKLLDVDVFDAETAAVVGRGGIVWRTDDAGESWISSTPDVGGPSGYRISTGSNGAIVLLATGGQCVWSVSGGRGWESRPLPSWVHRADAVSMIDDTSAIALAGAGGFASSVFVTNDEGRTWRESGSVGDGFLTPSLEMLSSSEGYVVGGQGVWRTADAGLTWTMVARVQAVLFDIAATGVGELVGVGYSGTLMRSTDGGTSWNEQSRDMATGTYRPQLTCVAMADENTGVAGGRYGGGLFRTRDGGESWAPVVGPDEVYELCFYDELNGVATPGGAVSPVHRTSDGGETWTAIPGTDGRYGRVHIDRSGLGILVMGGVVRRTTDGGRSWDAGVGDLGEAPALNAFVVTPEIVIVSAPQGGGILRSTNSGDGGWQVIPTPVGVSEFAFTEDRSVGIAMGSGRFLRTTDLGETWEVVGEYSHSLRSVAFLDDERAFAVGTFGRVYMSLDAGVSWELQMEAFGYPGAVAPVRLLHDLSFVDGAGGLAVGSGGVVLRMPARAD